MRILVTADLHYDIGRSRGPAVELAGKVCAMGGDAIVLVGDCAGADLKLLRECLGLFDSFSGGKFLVPGNHCLWRFDGESSMDRYERLVPRVAADAGWEVLDRRPAVMGDLGLVGSIGWYDYSFADEALGVPLDFYRAKVAPGAAAYLGGYEDMLRMHEGSLTAKQMAIGARWMDGVHVDLGMSDEAFTGLLCERLGVQLRQTAAKARRVAAFVHHLPFGELVPAQRPARFAFAAAFMGSAAIGRTLAACPSVTHVYCGHSHWPDRRRIGAIEAINVGSTYIAKRFEVLELGD